MSGVLSSQLKPSNPAFANPTPYQLRSLVLNYLCYNCYTDTAKAFSKDSTVRQLDPDGDEILLPDNIQTDSGMVELSDSLLMQVELRREIRTQLLSGNVDEATALLNKHFPSVLAEGSSPDTSMSSDDEESDTSSESSSSTSNDYVSSTSIEPLHLALNLRILAFCEACRTQPLEYPPASSNSNLPSMNTHPSDKPLNSHSENDINNPDQQMVLLTRAQKLYAFANTLPNSSDRATYIKELTNVGGLLAYKVPETSSIAKYLSMERREAVADQINRAILRRTGQPPISTIELLTRYTYALWLYANQHGVKPRPGVILPSTSGKVASKASESDGESVPLFDLQQFLEIKP